MVDLAPPPPSASDAPEPPATPARSYRIERLLVPEPEPRSPVRGTPRHLWVWGLAVLVLGGIAAGIPGSPPAVVPDATELPVGPAMPLPTRTLPPLSEGEWVTLVGTPQTATPSPAPAALPGWGVLSAPRLDGPVPAAPTFEAVLWGRGGEPSRLARPSPASAHRLLLGRGLGASRAESSEATRDRDAWRLTAALPQTDLDLAKTPQAVSLPPAYDGHPHHSGALAWVEGINYTDPVGAALPLLRARGYERVPISARFTVGDFATRDGAPYLRVAPDLVSGLERMWTLLGPVTVVSGYRHPQYNALRSVGGARYSRHQAGQAADVWSPTRSSLEIAHAALQAMGCGVGLGLGRNTVHVDVRGYLTTWTYPGAPVSATVFDHWVRQLCGSAAGAPPPLRPGVFDAASLALLESDRTDDEELVHVSEGALEEAVEEAQDSAPAATPARPTLNDVIRRDLLPIAQQASERDGTGILVVDLQDGETPTGAALALRTHVARATSPEGRLLGVQDLTRWVAMQPAGTYYVYAVRLPGGRVESGIAPLTAAPEAQPAPATPSASASAARARTPAAAPPPAPSARWLLVLGSHPSLADADAALATFEPLLARSGVEPVLRATRVGGTTGYDIVAGPFLSQAAAAAVRDLAAPALRGPAPIVPFSE